MGKYSYIQLLQYFRYFDRETNFWHPLLPSPVSPLNFNAVGLGWGEVGPPCMHFTCTKCPKGTFACTTRRTHVLTKKTIFKRCYDLIFSILIIVKNEKQAWSQ